jgi:hypothetical protein
MSSFSLFKKSVYVRTIKARALTAKSPKVSHGTVLLAKLWGWEKDQTDGKWRVCGAESDETTQSIVT